MIKLDYSKALLSAEQIAAFAPKAEEAQKALEAGTCAGNDFLGWTTLPNDYDKAEFAEIKKSAEKIAFMVRRYEEDGFTSYWL